MQFWHGALKRRKERGGERDELVDTHGSILSGERAKRRLLHVLDGVVLHLIVEKRNHQIVAVHQTLIALRRNGSLQHLHITAQKRQHHAYELHRVFASHSVLYPSAQETRSTLQRVHLGKCVRQRLLQIIRNGRPLEVSKARQMDIERVGRVCVHWEPFVEHA